MAEINIGIQTIVCVFLIQLTVIKGSSGIVEL